jgi:two-component system, LytTR family, response regulator
MSESRPLRVLIADDEALGRYRIEDLLRAEPGVEIVARSADGVEAIDAIRSLHPDLVFLDIQMPEMTGLEVVQEIGAERMPATIFVTAYDQHAIRAFDIAAVDYLVKPFDDERFELAFRRARERHRLQEVGRITSHLLSVIGAGRRPSDKTALPEGAEYLARIQVESRGQVRFLPVSGIDYVAASGSYAELHVGSQAHLIRERMQELERQLDPAAFVRIHRSAIVRLDAVESLRQRPGGDVAARLKDGTELPVSRRHRDELERRLRDRK